MSNEEGRKDKQLSTKY